MRVRGERVGGKDRRTERTRKWRETKKERGRETECAM